MPWQRPWQRPVPVPDSATATDTATDTDTDTDTATVPATDTEAVTDTGQRNKKTPPVSRWRSWLFESALEAADHTDAETGGEGNEAHETDERQ